MKLNGNWQNLELTSCLWIIFIIICIQNRGGRNSPISIFCQYVPSTFRVLILMQKAAPVIATFQNSNSSHLVTQQLSQEETSIPITNEEAIIVRIRRILKGSKKRKNLFN